MEEEAVDEILCLHDLDYLNKETVVIIRQRICDLVIISTQSTYRD